MSRLRISVALLFVLACTLAVADRLWNHVMAITCVNPNPTNQGDAWPASLDYSRFYWQKKKRCSKRLMNTGF
jgi:hypothetical protein